MREGLYAGAVVNDEFRLRGMLEFADLGKGPHGHGGDRRPTQQVSFLNFLPDIVEYGHPDCTAISQDQFEFHAAIDWEQTNHSTDSCPHDQHTHQSANKNSAIQQTRFP